nr:hypothetical protein [Tanacetum cinerariifolium]
MYTWVDKEVLVTEGSLETTTIILTGIDNDIYSTVDACPNACEMWKAIERSQQAATRKREKAIVNSPPPIYDQEPSTDNSPRISKGTGYDNQRIGNVVGTRESVGTTTVLKSRIQCYNCKEFRHVARECQKLERAKDAAYHKEKMLLCKQKEAVFQLNAEQADWKDDTDDKPKDQELEAHYMYMAQI